MKVLIFVIIVFVLSGLIIINNSNLHIFDKSDLETFGKVYGLWVDSLYGNVQNITGQVIRSNWFPE